mmetsp:Transcript_79107/g.212287  ORF Transcript_79107/g.212287 Transcript_79107/m.212287 type:complete len:147 (-) Transcript_79107:1035-1475(-)
MHASSQDAAAECEQGRSHTKARADEKRRDTFGGPNFENFAPVPLNSSMRSLHSLSETFEYVSVKDFESEGSSSGNSLSSQRSRGRGYSNSGSKPQHPTEHTQLPTKRKSQCLEPLPGENTSSIIVDVIPFILALIWAIATYFSMPK